MTYEQIVEGIENILKAASEMAEENKIYPKAVFEGIYPEILEFINRQQEQLEAAIAGQETLQKALAEKDRNIEHLNKEVDRLSQCVLYHDGHIEDAKSEAVREFANKLEEILGGLFLVHHPCVGEAIYKLLKEMAGDTE